MKEVYLCDAVRTAIGSYGGTLAGIRPDDLLTVPLKALLERNPQLPAEAIDDVIMGCANQAGEDNRNVARMSLLLAGIPHTVPGVTVNRLCASGLEAVSLAARTVRCGEGSLLLAGGVESMSRAPFVVSKSAGAYARTQEMADTTIGWRFINPAMNKAYGTDPLTLTAENIAQEYPVSRDDQDKFALHSQEKAQQAVENGRLAKEIIPVSIPQRKKDPLLFEQDEFLRLSPLDVLGKLRAIHQDGTVSAGNSSGVNDGACALIVADEKAVSQYGLEPKAQVIATAVAGVEPRTMGMGPVPASKKVLKQTGLSLDAMDCIELNEAFASQSLACLRELGLDDADPRVNKNGGAIALGHPLGMSGARLVTTACYELALHGGDYALCSMCVGVGQGIAMIIKKV